MVTIGRWHYSKPVWMPDSEEKIVLIHKSSLAPAEYFEWGIDAENQPYESYRWCEDDFYDDSNYDKMISTDELQEQIRKIQSLFSVNGRDDFTRAYDIILEKLNESCVFRMNHSQGRQ